MRKFTEILSISILVLAISFGAYHSYCEYFWGKFMEHKTTLPDEIRYAFKAVNNHENKELTLDNFMSFKWKREIVTTDHANWDLDYISFPSDSVALIYSSTEYLEEHYYSFPIFKTLLFDKRDKEANSKVEFDKENMELVYIANKPDFIFDEGEEIKRIKVEFENGSLIIRWPWI